MKLQNETTLHGKWYEDACGAAFALELIGERWALLIVRELMFGPCRFTDLRAGLPGISAKVLTERLEGLERAGIVARSQLPPPASTQVYELTPWGYMADEAIMELGRWAARSPCHDPTLPLSAASLMLSLRTMFDPKRAGGQRLVVAVRIGAQEFTARIDEGKVAVSRGVVQSADATIAAPVASVIASAVYGKRPFAALVSSGLDVSGDRAAAERFVDLFHLPEKIR